MTKKLTFLQILRKVREGNRKKLYYSFEHHIDNSGAICVTLFDFNLFIMTNVGLSLVCMSYPLSDMKCRWLCDAAKKSNCVSL